MKKFTLLCAGLMAAMGVNAQLMVDWDEEGQYKFYPENLVCEGGISYDEDNACFVSDGTPGKLLLNLNDQTIDFTEVARIEVNGSEYKDNPWGNDDPVGTLTINDAENGQINRWFGSRYNVNYTDVKEGRDKSYAELSAKVDSVYFDVRLVEEKDENGNVTDSHYVAGEFYIDEIILTKSVERDPEAISIEMWHNWTAWDETAEIDEANKFYGEDNVGKNIGVGAVVLGTGNVLGREFADLTEYAGIYIKGTPGMSLRLLFNRPDMEGGSAPISECNPVCDENGECSFLFTELANIEIEKFGAAYPYVHLNAVKTPWGLPEGCESVKVQKFNYIEKGSEPGSVDAIGNVESSEDVLYNVFGQRVDESYRGIVIKNGKKYINK